MFKVNENYLKLPGSYLFSTIGKKVSAYQAANPDKQIIRLGIGDVTQPLAPAIIEAMHKAVDEMGHAETFHGYAPDLGYEFLRSAMAKNDYQDKGCDIQADEIFISDGAKCDSGNIQEIFAADSKIAVCDPVYPVYVDTNVMAGRTGTYDAKTETWSNVIYMPCTKETNFAPALPEETPDIIYLCFPNNPTGSTITKAQLQEWVDYANRVVDDDCSDSISVIYPLLKLCFCDCGSCRVIRETQINDVRCLFRQCRCKVCFFCTRHVDHIAPCLCLCIVSSGTSCHYICINVHRVNRITHCDLTVCRKNFLNIS